MEKFCITVSHDASGMYGVGYYGGHSCFTKDLSKIVSDISSNISSLLKSESKYSICLNTSSEGGLTPQELYDLRERIEDNCPGITVNLDLAVLKELRRERDWV